MSALAVADIPRVDWSAGLVESTRSPLETFADLPIGENGERFDFAQSPWVRVVVEWWLDPAVEWIYLIQGSQTSKSTTMMGLLLHVAKNDPGPGFWVGAIEEEVDAFVTQRLKPFLEAADGEARTERKSDWRKTDLRVFGRMLMHFAWATSGAKLRSWPARYIFGDEVGIWPASVANIGNPLEYVKKRTRRYRRSRKGIFGTTPSSDLHPAWQAARRANFARWFVPCLECGAKQFLDFNKSIKFGMARTSNGEWDTGKVKKLAHFECEACGAIARESSKLEMIGRGEARYVDPDTGAEKELDRANTSRTLHIPGTYSPFTPWGDLAANFLEAKAEGTETLRVFVTDELAMPWREKTEAPDGSTIVKCIDRERAPGVIPEQAFAVTAFVDVQLSHVYYTVWAWGAAMRGWCVQYGTIPRPAETKQLDFLDEVLLTDYDGFPVHRAFIDQNYDTTFVQQYCRRVGWKRISPSRGVNSETAPPVHRVVIEKGPDGRPVPSGMCRWDLNPFYWKAFVHDHVKVTAGDPGEWRLHSETDPNFLRQILSEARVERVRGGQVTRDWVVTDRTAGNHYLDCCAGAAAAAWDLGVQRMRAPAPRKTLEAAETVVAKPPAVKESLPPFAVTSLRDFIQ